VDGERAREEGQTRDRGEKRAAADVEDTRGKGKDVDVEVEDGDVVGQKDKSKVVAKRGT
jgi:hypothetical protein